MRRAKAYTTRVCVLLRIIVGMVILGSIPAGPSAHAQLSDISYTLTPVLEGVKFDDDAALDDALLFGGKVGFGFGEFFELSGLYLFGNTLKTNLGDLTGFDKATTSLLAGLPARSLHLQQYGGELKFNLGRGAILPYLTFGAGVVRFEPADLNASRSIYLSGGIGLQYSVRHRYTLFVQAQNLSYRYNPGSAFLSSDDMASLGLTPGDFSTIDVNNFSANVGVQLYLGGRIPGSQTDLDRALERQLVGGWRGFSLRVEPTAGEIRFDEALGYRNHQRVVGVSTGIDLGPYAGLRGFYWRGTKEGKWSDVDDFHAYGGELKLAFSYIGGTLTPYVTLGGGYVNTRDGYIGNGVAAPDDRPFAVGGIGMILPLGNSLSLDVGARSLLMTTEGVDNVSDPGDVKASTLYSASISFGIGGGRRGAGTVFGREMEESKAGREQLAAGLSRTDRDLARAQARIDSLDAVVAAQQTRLTRLSAMDTIIPTTPGSAEATQGETKSAQAPRAEEGIQGETSNTPGTRWVSLPVPEEGELYLRYGPPGGVSVETAGSDQMTYYLDTTTGAIIPAPALSGGAAKTGVSVAGAAPGVPAPSATPGSSQLDELVRRTVSDEMAKRSSTASVQDSMSIQRIEQMLDNRLRAIESNLDRLEQEAIRPQAVIQQPARETAPVVVRETTAPPAIVTREPASETTIVAGTSGRTTKFTGLLPLTGYNLDKPHQGLLGVRAEFLKAGRPYRLWPEVILGFGDHKTTYNVNLNAVYTSGFGFVERVYPYGGLGLGFLDRDELELVLNIIVGTDLRMDQATFFVEYMNQDLFDNNRLLLGYRFDF